MYVYVYLYVCVSVHVDQKHVVVFTVKVVKQAIKVGAVRTNPSASCSNSGTVSVIAEIGDV